MTVWGNSGTEPPLCPPQSRLNGALRHKGALTMGRPLVCTASPSALSLSHSPEEGAGGLLALPVEAGAGRAGTGDILTQRGSPRETAEGD